MKLIILLPLLLLAGKCLAVGWEEVPKVVAVEKGISVELSSNVYNGCSDIKISMPQTMSFYSLGEREFWNASYKDILDKSKGWQLTSKGTKIKLLSSTQDNIVVLAGLCLSDEDLKSAYISAIYGGPQGAPPIVVLIELVKYK